MKPVRTGDGNQEAGTERSYVAMGIVLLIALLATIVLSLLGAVPDSRDHWNWSPTHGGRRMP